jgi:hypothetical protein
MNDVLRSIMRFHVFTELGVAPIDSVPYDMNRILASLPPDEARKLRRRFRKLWRAAAKAKASSSARPEREKRVLGLGAEKPSKSQKANRKALLLGRVFRDVEQRIKESKTAPMST